MTAETALLECGSRSRCVNYDKKKTAFLNELLAKESSFVIKGDCVYGM
jgi:hypothetical protein